MWLCKVSGKTPNARWISLNNYHDYKGDFLKKRIYCKKTTYISTILERFKLNNFYAKMLIVDWACSVLQQSFSLEMILGQKFYFLCAFGYTIFVKATCFFTRHFKKNNSLPFWKVHSSDYCVIIWGRSTSQWPEFSIITLVILIILKYFIARVL